jgi:ABC-type uncharacterized transport system auxiliary subunit
MTMTNANMRHAAALLAAACLALLNGCSDSTNVEVQQVYSVSVTGLEVTNKDTGEPIAAEQAELSDSVVIVP